MRMLIKKLLKKHKYPPEGMDDALQTVMLQCELWTDNVMDVEPEQKPHKTVTYDFSQPRDIGMGRRRSCSLWGEGINLLYSHPMEG